MPTRTPIRTSVLIVTMFGLQAHADTVIPTKGQTPDQIEKDVAECQTQAKTTYDQTLTSANQTAAASSATDTASGGRLKGAAVGAAAGAASAQAQGKRYDNYDNVDSDCSRSIGRTRPRMPPLPVPSSAAPNNAKIGVRARRTTNKRRSNRPRRRHSLPTLRRSRRTRHA
jgi:hypothetical protein